jgi:hypothetical protein
LELGAGYAIDLAAMPKVASGPELTIAWRALPLCVEAFGHLWLAQTSTLAGTAIGGDFSAYDLGIRGGLGLALGGVELGPRLGVELYHMSAEAFGATNSSRGSDTWTSLSAGGLLAWVFARPVALRLEIDANVPLSRPEFVIVGAGIVHKPAALSARAAVGLGVRFF